MARWCRWWKKWNVSLNHRMQPKAQMLWPQHILHVRRQQIGLVRIVGKKSRHAPFSPTSSWKSSPCYDTDSGGTHDNSPPVLLAGKHAPKPNRVREGRLKRRRAPHPYFSRSSRKEASCREVHFASSRSFLCKGGRPHVRVLRWPTIGFHHSSVRRALRVKIPTLSQRTRQGSGTPASSWFG